MIPDAWNTNLLFIALLLFIVALVYLIFILYRANSAMSRVEHLSVTFTGIVEKLMPALLNIGTITAAVEALIKMLPDNSHKQSASKKK